MLEQLRKNKKLWVVVAAGIVLVIGIIIVAVTLHNNSGDSKESDKKIEAEDGSETDPEKEPEREFNGEGLKVSGEDEEEDEIDASGSWDNTDDSKDKKSDNKKNNGSNNNNGGNTDNPSGGNEDDPGQNENPGQGNDNPGSDSDISEEGTLPGDGFGMPFQKNSTIYGDVGKQTVLKQGGCDSFGCGNNKIRVDFRGFSIYTKNKTEIGGSINEWSNDTGGTIAGSDRGQQ